jgi:probable F420-dependent oxidoreductase
MSSFESYDHLATTVCALDALHYDSLWVGDHIAFTSPVLDPIAQLAQAAALSDRLTVGTAIYLLPLRAAAIAAKQSSSLDHLSRGRFVFGVGVGGEFPNEFDACGVPVKERGARLEEGIEVVRTLWHGEPCSFEGRFSSFSDVQMQPAAYTENGPPIWCGGRSEAALARIGRAANGWIAYVVTPEQYRQGLATIAQGAASIGRRLTEMGTSHLLFVRMGASRAQALDDATEILSKRYAMDFRRAAERYCALGTPAEVLQHVQSFYDVGVRHFILEFLGSPTEQAAQLEQFAAEVLPAIREL